MIGLRDIARLVSQHHYRFAHEAELQRGIAVVFDRAGVPYVREAEIGPRERIDFLVEGAGVDGVIGLEIKTQHATNEVLRQLGRYADSPRLTALMLVTSRLRLVSACPATLAGKPLVAIHLCAGAFR